jgi:hypothetical protein
MPGGPAPGSTCTACNHPGIVLITKAINDGQSDYKVAGAFGLPRGVIQRHRTNRHQGVTQAAATRGKDLGAARRADPPPGSGDDLPDLGPDATPREKLQALVSRLEQEVQGLDYLKPDLARELRLAYADLEKMADGLPPAVVRAADVPGLVEFLYDVHRALQPFPEARRALEAVFAKHRHVGVDPDAAAES